MRLRMLLQLFLILGLGMNTFGEDYRRWSLEKAVEILNDSPWARQETFTRVIRGVGSGVSGEKEIYNTFYVRFLSARPIREAYARIQQIQLGYDALSSEDRSQFDRMQQPMLEFGEDEWIVVCLSFRSNDPNEESTVRRFFLSETAKTLSTKAFLSTPDFSQVEIRAYFPPVEDFVGAKFVFPREIEGHPVVSGDEDLITFELLEVPGADPRLRSSFRLKDMLREGKLIL